MVDKKRIQRSSTTKLRAKRQRQTELSIEVFQPPYSSEASSARGLPALSPLYIPPILSSNAVPPPPVQAVPFTPTRIEHRNEQYPLPSSIAYLRGQRLPAGALTNYIALIQQEVRRCMPQYSPATWEEVRESMGISMSKPNWESRDYRCEMCAMLVLGVPPNTRIRAKFDKADDPVEVDLDWDYFFLRPAIDAPPNAFGTICHPGSPIVWGNREVTVLQTYWLRTEPDPEDKVFLLYELNSGRGVKKGWMQEPLYA